MKIILFSVVSVKFFIYMLQFFPCSFCDVLFRKCARQQFFQCKYFKIIRRIYQNYLKCFRITKFCHNLTAHPTRIQVIIGIPIDRNRRKFLLSFGNSFKKSGTLRTVSRCVRGIFDIASLVYLSIFCKQCCSYPEM